MKDDVINTFLGITESYRAPQAMLEKILDKTERENLFQKFLEHESDLSYEWFQGYFENEHSDRKVKKQDFTPNSISNLLAKITGSSNSYFESAAGTGGILIKDWNNNIDNKQRRYQVEELSERAIPFLLFNMSIRGINGLVLRGDSLTRDYKEIYELKNTGKYSDVSLIEQADLGENKFGSVLMNPPYSASWSSDKAFLDDSRFNEYGRLAPKSRADFAFLLHGFYHLKETGTMAIVLPHGVLFRGAAEGIIRNKLLENGAIDAIIGMPANLFFNTSIPTTIIVLKKNRTTKNVLFIDASKDFEKGKNQNFLQDKHINKILETYAVRKDVDKYAHVASWDEIVDNDFNLNIPRHVDTFEEEEPIDLVTVAHEIMLLGTKIKGTERSLLKMLDDLQVTDENRKMIEGTKAVFRGELR